MEFISHHIPSLSTYIFLNVRLDRQASLLSHLPIAVADSQTFLLTLEFDL